MGHPPVHLPAIFLPSCNGEIFVGFLQKAIVWSGFLINACDTLTALSCAVCENIIILPSMRVKFNKTLY
jgi:hypothetical protein